MLRQVACRVAMSMMAAWAAGDVVRAESGDVPLAVVCERDASFLETLAAKEIRRYVYLRSGELLPIVEDLRTQAGRGLIVVGCKCREVVRELLRDAKLKTAIEELTAEQYVLKTIQHGGRSIVLVAGGDGLGTLYGSYRLAEHLGVRFYMHGDVVPDERVALKMPQVDETGKPLFDRRGIQPFHDFPEGPDWWNADGYKAVLAQLPKMRMNFFGLHTYPQGGVGPEPAVWIGTADDVGADGRVKSSYPSRHFTTRNVTGAWGYQATKTSDYLFGAAVMYDRDDYAADYMRGTHPWTKMSPDDCNELFDRFGAMLGDVFTFAHRLGIKTCIGTEAPLTVPTPVADRLKAAGKDPKDPAVVQELYEGMFRRIIRTHPLDYYWLWTPEGWTWSGTKQEQIDATLADFRAAIAATRKVEAPFTLATCGWVLGPPQDRALFDNVLPKDMPVSCINRQVGHDPVEPGFADVQGRPQWAIPWLEDDPAMISPQLWVGRMRKDAADSLAYGCTGLMGIHWRTRILGPNVSALAKAAWDQQRWNPSESSTADRFLATDDFYADWALSQFGPEAAKPIAELFVKLDGKLPRPSDWVNGPGGIKPDERPWEDVRKEYAFVDEMASLREKVRGAGNLERFDYWLNNFRYLRANGQVNCTWARFNAAMKKVKAETAPDARQRLARIVALPIREELVAQVGDLHGHLLATVNTPGSMGNVTNWQQHIIPTLLTAPGEELAKILGENLPDRAMPVKENRRDARLFVPVIRTSLVAGEPLTIPVIVLSSAAGSARVTLHWRPLGEGEFAKVPARHVARGVYSAGLSADAIQTDLEYYVEAHIPNGSPTGGAESVGGVTSRFPATAPKLNQTVVVLTR